MYIYLFVFLVHANGKVCLSHDDIESLSFPQPALFLQHLSLGDVQLGNLSFLHAISSNLVCWLPLISADVHLDCFLRCVSLQVE